jgi:hypothetical protein
MAEETRVLSRHDLEAKIVQRCWENEAFRQEFTADPAGAFVKYLDCDLATLPQIVVHEERAGSWHIVVPAKPTGMAELTDEELERVAGGVTPLAPAAMAAGKVLAVAGAGGSGAAAVAGGSVLTPVGFTILAAVLVVGVGIAVNEGNKKSKKKHW